MDFLAKLTSLDQALIDFLWRDVAVRAMLFENLGRNKRFGSVEPDVSLRQVSVIVSHMIPRRLGVIWSSDQAHTVDALAVRGDEGRGSLRKASGSRQQTLHPEMSEWGNPPRKRYPMLNL